MLSPDADARNLFLEHSNAVLMCRFVVKTIIDKSSVKNVEEDSDDVVNLIAAIEQVLSHGVKKTRSYYDFVAAACRKVPNHCLPTIEALGFLRHGLAKGRAWLKLALMEKRLSLYLDAALQQRALVRNFYSDHAIMLSDDMNVLLQDLVGLSALDFRFCLKIDSAHPEVLMAVDLAPYLRFQQCEESVLSDIQEASRSAALDSSAVCSCHCGSDVKNTQSYVNWQEKFDQLQTVHKQVCDQKAKLEETCRQQSRQLDDCQLRVKQLSQRMSSDAAAWACERRRPERLVTGLRLEMLALVDSAADDRSMASVCESGVAMIGNHHGVKEDSHSLKPLVGSLYSNAFGIAASELSGLDHNVCDSNGTSGCINDHDDKDFVPDNLPRCNSVQLRVQETSYCLSEASHSFGDTQTQRFVSTDRETKSRSKFMLRCQPVCAETVCKDNTMDGTANTCSPNVDENSGTSPTLLSLLLENGPPPLAHCIAYVSTDDSEEFACDKSVSIIDMLSDGTTTKP